MKKVLILILTIFSFNSFSQSEKWENLMEIEGVKIDKTIIGGVNIDKNQDDTYLALDWEDKSG